MIGPKLANDEKWCAGVSYITLPPSDNRDEYILNCFLTGTVTILSEAGGFIHNVPIDKNSIQLIEFPKNPGEFGTQIFYVTDPIHNKQVIVAVLQAENENQDNAEGEYVIKRIIGRSTCEIRINPGQETISLSATGESPDIIFSSVGGTWQVMTTEIQMKSKVSDEQIQTVKQIVVGTKAQHSRYVQNSRGHLFEGTEFILNEKEEAMVLGNVLEKFLGKFVDRVSEITVATAIGTQPIINKAQVMLLKEEIKLILSDFAYLRKNGKEG